MPNKRFTGEFEIVGKEEITQETRDFLARAEKKCRELHEKAAIEPQEGKISPEEV